MDRVQIETSHHRQENHQTETVNGSTPQVEYKEDEFPTPPQQINIPSKQAADNLQGNLNNSEYIQDTGLEESNIKSTDESEVDIEDDGIEEVPPTPPPLPIKEPILQVYKLKKSTMTRKLGVPTSAGSGDNKKMINTNAPEFITAKQLQQ